MKKVDLRLNTLFFSQRFKCYGQCVAIADFMAYMIFAKKEHPSAWYHCAELSRSHFEEEND